MWTNDSVDHVPNRIEKILNISEMYISTLVNKYIQCNVVLLSLNILLEYERITLLLL